MKKSAVHFLLSVVFCFVILSFCSFSICYNYKSVAQQDNDTLSHIEQLKVKYGQNKIIPKQIEEECLVALSHFPELARTRIDFTYGTIRFTMQTQPQLDFVFKKKNRRTYTIKVNNNPKAFTGLDYNALSLTTKIGWIGHELSHIVDYEQKNIGQIIKLGACYPFTSFKSKVEKRVDRIAIQHGLGQELYEGVDYMLNQSTATERYKRGHKKHYLPLREIELEMNIDEK